MRYFVALLLAAAPVSAQTVYDQSTQFLGMDAFTLGLNGKHEISMTAGAFRPTADFKYSFPGFQSEDEFGRTGYMFALDLLRNVNQVVAVGGEWLYISRESRVVNNVYPPNTLLRTRVRGDTNAFMGVIRLRAPGKGFRPYGVAAAGWSRTRFDLFGTFVNGGPEVGFVSDAKAGFAMMFRGGIEYSFNTGTFAALEGGFLKTGTKDYGPTATGAASGFLPVSTRADGISLAARLGARFGGSGY